MDKDDLVLRIIAEIDKQANARRRTGEGLVYSYGEVERGVIAALRSRKDR
jgi:hypothetical protein